MGPPPETQPPAHIRRPALEWATTCILRRVFDAGLLSYNLQGMPTSAHCNPLQSMCVYGMWHVAWNMMLSIPPAPCGVYVCEERDGGHRVGQEPV